MNTIDIQQIKIAPNRQRRKFGEKEIQELATSIETLGLLHPIVLRSEGADWVLVAGERRLRAIQDIYDLGGRFNFDQRPVPPGQVPFSTLGELSAIEAMEAELEENIRRVDLSWQDRARATTDLLALRTAQAEAKGDNKPSVNDIARELANVPANQAVNSMANAVAEDLKVARSLADPEVAAAKSRGEALKIIKKKAERHQNQLLAEAVGKTHSSAIHTVFHQNGKDYAASLPPESFDVILTDPPYGMGADEFGDSDGKTGGEHFYVDSEDVLVQVLTWFPEESFRLAKPEAHLYVFCDIAWFSAWSRELSLAGWEVFRTPLIWAKTNSYRAPWPDGGPQRRYELILYARKGKMKVQKMLSDVLTHAADQNLGHQAQKPVGLFTDLLSRSAFPGAKVWDPFCGTGTIFPAAHALKCQAVGCEIDQAAYGIAVKRIGELK